MRLARRRRGWTSPEGATGPLQEMRSWSFSYAPFPPPNRMPLRVRRSNYDALMTEQIIFASLYLVNSVARTKFSRPSI